VYRAVTVATIVGGGHEVGMVFADGTVVPAQDWMASVAGTGAPSGPAGSLQVARVVPTGASDAAPEGAPALMATWSGREEPTALAWLTD
jgi:hypothetical protein